MTQISGFKIAMAAALAVMGLQTSADAQQVNYPQRPITLIAATAPGGPGDTAARLIAEKMTPILGQQVVVENAGGAGGALGAQRVALADPDGYTLLLHQTGLAVAPAINPNLTFNVRKDFVTVGLVNTSYFFLIGRETLPPKNFPELVAWMKSNPAKFAHPGVGSLGHLTTLLFANHAGAKPDLIVYRGIGPALNDLLGGHVDLLWPGAVAAAPLTMVIRFFSLATGITASAVDVVTRSPIMSTLSRSNHSRALLDATSPLFWWSALTTSIGKDRKSTRLNSSH